MILLGRVTKKYEQILSLSGRLVALCRRRHGSHLVAQTPSGFPPASSWETPHNTADKTLSKKGIRRR
jgi:hypothetical protein